MKQNSLMVYRNFDSEILNLTKTPKNYSFLNLSSVGYVFKDLDISRNFIYFCDGWMGCLLFSLLSKKKIKRVSFDFTSIAGEVFHYAERNDKSIYFVGASQKQLDCFVEKISKNYPELTISGSHNGYFSDSQRQQIIDTILSNKTDIVVVSMGAGKQESFLHKLSTAGFLGTGFTCGGFIRQEATGKPNYYPCWINRYHLRAFYRMIKEPHTVKRYMIDYPINSVKICLMVLRKKIEIN